MNKRREHANIRAIRLWHSLCPLYFPLMILKCFFGCFSPYFNIYMSAEIINVISRSRNINNIVLLIVVTIFGNLFISVMGSLLDRAYHHKTMQLDQREKVLFNDKVLSLDYSDLENTKVRQLRRKIDESGNMACGKEILLASLDAITFSIVDICLSVYLFAEMFFLMARAEFSWPIVLFCAVMIVLVVLNIWMNFYTRDKVAALSNDISDVLIEENRIDDSIDCYNMGKDVRLYRQDKLIMRIRDYSFDLHKRAYEKLYTKKYKIEAPASILSYCLQATIYIFVSLYALKEIFQIGSLVKYIGFTQRLFNAVIRLFTECGRLKYNTPFIEDYLSFLDIPELMQQGTLKIGSETLKGIKAFEIEFRNVSFQYPGSDSYVLKNVSLTIHSGARMAIVGMNGSGKTTFIKLLCRLYDPTEGQILLNGIDCREYDYQDYMSMLSVVFQDFHLFSFSLAQNVAVSEEYEKMKVERCLRMAGFSDRLSSLPNGIETPLYQDFDEEGVEISGGEAQKIALARALYKNAPLIILDEPTAALDPIAEFEIYEHFNQMIQDKTAIYISHRLSSCRFCDEIAVFDAGKIVQKGSHDTLLTEKTGKYYELWQAQAQYYV